MTKLRLVVFDVDGTLVDSQGDIILAMDRAFAAVGLRPPPPDQVRGIIGLSLPIAMQRLVPEQFAEHGAALVEAYRGAYAEMRQQNGVMAGSPLFPGAAETLDLLAEDPWTLLGVATGKSRRGLDKLIEGHGLQGRFVTTQVADDHPSKPHPSMLLATLAETGTEADEAVMIGDTSFDIDMGRAAGFACIGVSWGYHPVEALRAAGAKIIIDSFAELPSALQELWSLGA